MNHRQLRNLNRITQQQTAFGSFEELLTAAGNYRPTIELSNWDRRRLAAAYDAEQERRGDDRRAYTYRNDAMTVSRRERDHEAALELDRWYDEVPYEANDSHAVYSNQGYREGWILAVIGRDVLIEYEMPAGTTAMLLFTVKNRTLRNRRNVSYARCPQKWIRAMQAQGIKWVGMGQRAARAYPFPG